MGDLVRGIGAGQREVIWIENDSEIVFIMYPFIETKSQCT